MASRLFIFTMTCVNMMGAVPKSLSWSSVFWPPPPPARVVCKSAILTMTWSLSWCVERTALPQVLLVSGRRVNRVAVHRLYSSHLSANILCPSHFLCGRTVNICILWKLFFFSIMHHCSKILYPNFAKSTTFVIFNGFFKRTFYVMLFLAFCN